MLRSYCVGLLRDGRPGIYPHFFQVDLLPPILGFTLRSEGVCNCRDTLVNCANYVFRAVYLYLLSLLPLWQAVSLVRFAVNIKKSVQLGDQKFGTPTTVKNSLATAVVELLLAIVATLRQLAKVARLRGMTCSVVPTIRTLALMTTSTVLHHLVAHEIVSLSLTAVSLVLLVYLLIYVAINIIKEQYDITYVPGMNLLSILSSFILLESMSGEPLKGELQDSRD